MCAARDWPWWGREEDGFPRGNLRHCYGDRGGRSSPASCRLSSAPLRWPSAQLLAQCRSPPDRSCPVVCTQTFSPLPPGPPLLTRNTAFVLVSLSQVRLHGMQIDVHRERIAGRQALTTPREDQREDRHALRKWCTHSVSRHLVRNGGLPPLDACGM